MKIYSNSIQILIKFLDVEKSNWFFNITTICDLNALGSLMSLEVLVYEEPEINFQIIANQFDSQKQVEIDPLGTILIRLLEDTVKRGGGFGRKASVEISNEGYLCAVQFSWNEPGAGTPDVDWIQALKGIEYLEMDFE